MSSLSEGWVQQDARFVTQPTTHSSALSDEHPAQVRGLTWMEDLDAAEIKVAPADHALSDVLELKQRLVQHLAAAFTAQAQLAGQVLEPDVGRGEAVQHYVAHLSHQFRERLRRVDLQDRKRVV